MVKLLVSTLGTKQWFLNKVWHRTNGPAIAYHDGEKSWYWHGRPVSEYEHMMQEQANG